MNSQIKKQARHMFIIFIILISVFCTFNFPEYAFKTLLLISSALLGSFFFNCLKLKLNINSDLFLKDFNILGAEAGIIFMLFIYSFSFGTTESKETQKQNNFREALNILRKSQIRALKAGTYNEMSISKYYFEELMNNPSVKKICPTNSELQGCWEPQKQHSVEWETQESGVELNSGADITGFGIKIEKKTGYDGIYIDWNGTDGPNEYGDDQLWVMLCFSKICGFHGDKAPYSISPYNFCPYGPSQSKTDIERNEKLFKAIQWHDPMTEDDKQYLGILSDNQK